MIRDLSSTSQNVNLCPRHLPFHVFSITVNVTTIRPVGQAKNLEVIQVLTVSLTSNFHSIGQIYPYPESIHLCPPLLPSPMTLSLPWTFKSYSWVFLLPRLPPPRLDGFSQKVNQPDGFSRKGNQIKSPLCLKPSKGFP